MDEEETEETPSAGAVAGLSSIAVGSWSMPEDEEAQEDDAQEES
jgi:hypothetical protein